jgi:acetyltransferase-like isoleucine patch superfamily enzyme
MSALGRRLHWLVKRASSVRRRFSSVVWRAILGRLGAGSSIGPGWQIERPESVFIGDSVILGREGWISFGRANPDEARFIVGNGAYIGNYFLASVVKKIEIADKVMISDRVFIGDCNHRHSRADVPIMDQGLDFGGEVKIGFGSWIGLGAAILPGVSIGRNCVIGANAVVTDNVPDGAVVGGIPAKPLS